MLWDSFLYFALSIMLLWMAAVANMYFNKKPNLNRLLTLTLTTAGVIIFSGFVLMLWAELQRPPMRTLGETRLWYALLAPIIGITVYQKWQYKWFLTYSLFLAAVFIVINVCYPQTRSKTLMPALQSIWFIPHVLVYMFAYAFLAASSFVAARGLWDNSQNKTLKENDNSELLLADNLVFIGFAFLSMGLIFGALWAKKAWGHYWTWDPKETWAFISWAAYLIYIHLRYTDKQNKKLYYRMLVFAFAVLLICWFGVNYLPSAVNSVHTYSN